MSKINKIAKYATKGGAILTVASVGLACHKIANTDNTLQKNHILVGSLGSVAGGLATGLALFLIATPVGWVAALVIGAGAFAVSYWGGQAFKGLYDAYAEKRDFVEMTGVSQVCR